MKDSWKKSISKKIILKEADIYVRKILLRSSDKTDERQSAIREMFKRMADPEIISLAGGNPASELFPGEELSKIAGKILMNKSDGLHLQYGTTDGYAPNERNVRRKRAGKG